LNSKEFYKKVVDTYGSQQVIVAIEELSELQKELCKALRYNYNYDNIVEEIADVEIMLEQMKIYFNILNKDLERMKEHKIERTKERLGL
jgi:NTP pyrophosphatase (non-canonical NTP hydrolase)